MRKYLTRLLLGAIATIGLAFPASAATWRSPAGDIFRFYPDGSMVVYWNGAEHVGYWWWISSKRKFGYSVAGQTCYVTVEGNGAICSGAGQPQHWSLMSVRGEGDDEVPADTRSWFMTRETPGMKPKR
jgi:hypothetical protein